MIELYQQISERLAQQLPQLQYIDWDCGQYETPDEYYTFVPPAVLIGIDVAWNNQSQGKQNGTATVTLRIWADTPEDSHIQSLRADHYAGQLTIINQVHRAIHGFRGTHFNALLRTRTEREKGIVGGTIMILTYTCNVVELLG